MKVAAQKLFNSYSVALVLASLNANAQSPTPSVEPSPSATASPAASVAAAASPTVAPSPSAAPVSASSSSSGPVRVNYPSCNDSKLKTGDYCIYVKGNVRRVSKVININEQGDKSIHFLTDQEMKDLTNQHLQKNATVPVVSASPAASPSASPSASVSASPAAQVKDDTLAGCKRTDQSTIICPDGTYEKTTKVNELMVKELVNKAAGAESSPSPAADNAKTGN